MKRKFGLRRYAGLTAVVAAAAVMVLTIADAASADGSFNWNGVNGVTACAPGTTGTVLWIFNPHGDAAPTDLYINGVKATGTGWEEMGNGSWHFTADITFDFPPTSAYVDYTGTLGDNPILTISGCNEGTTPPAAAPTIRKTAGQSQNTNYVWGITKGVDQNSANTSTTATFNYTVTATPTGTTTVGDVTGKITVFNNAGGDITLASLSDQLSDGTPCTLDNQPVDLTIPASSSVDFPYSCGLSARPTDYPDTTNTVTMTWGDQTLSSSEFLAAGSDDDTVPVDFSATVSDNCANVTDQFDGGGIDQLGYVCANNDPAATDLGTLDNFNESYDSGTGAFTFTYSRTIGAPLLGNCVSHDNTASFLDNSNPQVSGSASKTVMVCNVNAALTPGYWKNHLVFDRKNPTNPYVSEYLPQYIGAYKVDTTAKTTAVFNAMNCASSTYAISCLAGHLLAAEFNVANGSYNCINSVIALAKMFLTNPPATSVTYGGYTATSVNYTGPVPSYSGLTSTQRSLALALKNALDKYNNGGGC